MEKVQNDITMTEETELPDDLEVLRSIYPEIQLQNGGRELVLEIKLEPESKIDVILQSSVGKELGRFQTKYFEPLRFHTTLPMRVGVVEIESSWISLDLLDEMKAKINNMVQDAVETDMMDSLLYTVIDYLTVDLIQDFYGKLFNNDIKTESESYYKELQQTSHEQRLLNFAKDRFTCSICLDSYDGVDGLLLDCDHAFCKPCFKEYAIQIINNSDDVSKLQCPNCPIPNPKNLHLKTTSELRTILFTPKITKSTLSQVVEPELVEKYETLRHNFLFEKFQQYYPFSCSKCPRCSHWVFRDDVDDKLVICDHCKLAYCFECNHSWHGTTNYCGSKLNSIPYEIIEEMLQDDTSESRKEKLSQMYGRRTLKLAIDAFISEKLFREAVENEEDLMSCPKCSTVVTKSDGCNKMKCSVCSFHFCYLCGELLDTANPYTHFADLKSECYGKLFEGMPGTEDL